MKQHMKTGIKGMRSQIGVFFALVLAGLALPSCRGQKSDLPPIHLNPNMDTQARLDPQEKADFFPDGQAMRPLVPHTLPSGYLREEEDVYQGKNAGVFVEQFPSSLKLDMAFAEKGRRRFDTYCTPCHGPIGDGKGMVAARGYPPVTNLQEDRIRQMPVGQIYAAIAEGVRNMPSYASQIEPKDRWAIVLYVRALQKSQQAKLEDVPEQQRSSIK